MNTGIFKNSFGLSASLKRHFGLLKAKLLEQFGMQLKGGMIIICVSIWMEIFLGFEMGLLKIFFRKMEG